MPPVLRAAALAAALLTSGCSGSRPRVLVVYTSMDSERIEAAERLFEGAHEDVDARMVLLAPDDALTRMRAGGGDRPDVWWGAPLETLVRAADEGLLAPVRPRWADRAPAADAAGRWHALPDPTPFVLAFDTEQLTLSRAPRDWSDLAHPRWVDELVLVDPDTDRRTRDFLGAVILEELRRTGDEDAGFDFLVRLDWATRLYAPDVRDVLRRLHTGDGSMTILPLDEVRAAVAGGAEWLQERRMESGAPAVLRGVAVVEGAPDPTAASAFLDLVGATEGEPPEAAVWPPAPDTVSDRLEVWMDRWRLEVRGRGRLLI